MSESRHLPLDFRSVELFLTIIETQSLTATAQRLNVTQSAVSHALERLRGIFQDPLFIRSGRGITATPRALDLAESLTQINAQVKSLAQPVTFQPEAAHIHWRIAANDLQRDALLPKFYQRVAAQVASFSLNIYPSEIPNVEHLRSNKTDLIISPIPPDAPDIIQKKIFTDKTVCFYDPNVRAAPQSMDDFARAHYIGLSFLENKNMPAAASSVNVTSRSFNIDERTRIRVSNFSGLAQFLRGSEFLVLMPKRLTLPTMAGFASCAIPWTGHSLSMHMLWHQRHHKDETHQWLRNELLAVLDEVGEA